MFIKHRLQRLLIVSAIQVNTCPTFPEHCCLSVLPHCMQDPGGNSLKSHQPRTHTFRQPPSLSHTSTAEDCETAETEAFIISNRELLARKFMQSGQGLTPW